MKLLLHVCCAPCMLGCIEKIDQNFDITCYFYNPNIYPFEEYEKRLEEVKKVLKERYKNVKLIVEKYNHEDFIEAISGLEEEKEGGVRCENCIELRMEKTAKMAKDCDFDYFDSTLSVSPHKNFQFIQRVGQKLQEKYNEKYLSIDFKKQDGFLKSTKLSKELGIYRQNYCGCEFSLTNKEQ